MSRQRVFRSRLEVHQTEFIEVVLQIRGSLCATNWSMFIHNFFDVLGIKLPIGTLQKLGASYTLSNSPNPELIYLLTRPRLFCFPNREVITFESMYEVYFGDRSQNGDLL
jgi:hypothetical protein